MTTYEYDPLTKSEVERMLRLAMPSGLHIRPATLLEDFGGIDGHMYRVGTECPVQVRQRKDRPYGAEEEDITFRTTEMRMMEQHTYPPLMAFLWFRKGYAEHIKVIDVYRMWEHVDPPLRMREPIRNVDGRSAFIPVEIHELVRVGALLMQGNRDRCAPARVSGEKDLERILQGKSATYPPTGIRPPVGVKGARQP